MQSLDFWVSHGTIERDSIRVQGTTIPNSWGTSRFVPIDVRMLYKAPWGAGKWWQFFSGKWNGLLLVGPLYTVRMDFIVDTRIFCLFLISGYFVKDSTCFLNCWHSNHKENQVILGLCRKSCQLSHGEFEVWQLELVIASVQEPVVIFVICWDSSTVTQVQWNRVLSRGPSQVSILATSRITAWCTTCQDLGGWSTLWSCQGPKQRTWDTLWHGFGVNESWPQTAIHFFLSNPLAPSHWWWPITRWWTILWCQW